MLATMVIERLDPTLKRAFVRRFAVNAGLVGIFAAIGPILGGAKWLTNDDIAIVEILSGGYTGSPQPNAIFINRFLGVPLSALYEVAPSFSWYAAFLLMTGALSLALAGAVVCQTTLLQVAWLAIAAPVASWLSLRPSFTGTAFVVSFMGLLILISSDRVKAWPFAAGTIFFVVGALTRSEAAIGALVFALPAIAISFWANKRRLARFLIICIVVAMPSLALGTQALHLSCIGTDQCAEWQSYNEFNYYRGLIHDNPRSLTVEGSSVGWTSAATDLFFSFSYGDHPAFGPESVIPLAQSSDFVLRLSSSSILGHMWNVARVDLGFRLYVFAVTLAVVLLTLLFSRSTDRPLTALTATVVPVYLLVLLAALDAVRLTAAVEFLSVPLMALSVLTILRRTRLIKASLSVQQLSGAVIGAACLAYSVVGAKGAIELSRQGDDFWTSMNRALSQIESRNSGGNAIFASGTAADIFSAPPYAGGSNHRMRNVILAGWPVSSPPFESRLGNFGLTSIYDALDKVGPWPTPEPGDLLLLMDSAGAKSTAEFMSIQAGYELRIPIRIATIDGTNLALWKLARVTQ